MKEFKSFVMGGFECADQINGSGNRINLLKETQHDTRVEEDYRELKELGMLTVREGICWSLVEPRPGYYDFDEVLNRIQSAQKYGIEQIWDIIHFGYPDDIYPTHPKFTARFVALCEAFTIFYFTHSPTELRLIPINEISYISWLSGEIGGAAPFITKYGWELKYLLCKSAIQGIKAIRSIRPTVEVYLVEPLIWVHPWEILDIPQAELENSYQFQAADIIMGKICPELGGSPELIDGVGVNYYWNCQWKLQFGTLPWPDLQNHRKPISELLQLVWERYKKPLFFSETGHFGSGRAEWMEEIYHETSKAIALGVDIRGICIYPLVDRPNWDHLEIYHNSGLWDLSENKDRIPVLLYVEAIQDGLKLFESRIKSLMGNSYPTSNQTLDSTSNEIQDYPQPEGL
ncbi:amine oxidase [Algoriphagus sp.]|uniref:amine oxidase n=1 Tax=Algoriphagus sp. TaxID=1872435 RepID=UPI0039194DD9